MKDYLLFPFRVLRYLFWWVNVSPWWIWKALWRGGSRFAFFRNRRNAAGARLYTHYRWGFMFLGLSIGDRGGTREYMREKLFGPRKAALQHLIDRLRDVVGVQSTNNDELACKLQHLIDHYPTREAIREATATAWQAGFYQGREHGYPLADGISLDTSPSHELWWRIAGGAEGLQGLEPDGHYTFPDGDTWRRSEPEEPEIAY